MANNACTAQYVDHVGIAVRDIEAAMKSFQDAFQIPPGVIEELANQGVRATLLPIGQTRLELLEPLTPESPVGRFIERRGEGLHHLALHVENLADSLTSLSAAGLELIDKEPRPGLSGIIAFVHPRSVHGILTELVQTA
jgi:methylmalonyl-CoA/ethylmalonyl-CoA epimerase